MPEYLKTKEGFLSQLLKHLRTSAIMDLVLKFVTCVENKSSRLDIAQVRITTINTDSLKFRFLTFVHFVSSGFVPNILLKAF